MTVRVKGAGLPPGLAERLEAVDPDRTYTVATNSYVSANAAKYFPAGIEGSEDSGMPMRETVIEAVRERGGLE